MALILSSAGSSSTLPTSSATRKKKKRSQLIDAVNHGNVEKIIKLLVKCDPNFIDESSGETPLSLAASNGSLQTTTTQRVIVALVNGGAMLDFRTKEGRTALHVAVLKSNYVALKTFLGLGASPDCQDSNSLTPLFYSIIHKANPKLTQLLLHEHAMIGCADQQGWQEAHHACKLGLSGHLENLLYYGTDMNAKIAGSGNTALHVAAINDQKECAKLLLLRGSDTSLVNNSHQNAHQVAVIAGNLDLAEMIKNFKSEQVMPYREKPKYNPARQRSSTHSPAAATATSDRSPALPPPPPPSSTTSSGHHLSINSKNMSNGTCCPSSPCLSQRSCATSTTISTSTTSSSGVCCELDHSSQTESVTSEDDPRTQISAAGRIEGRREQKFLGSSTLPSRGRRANGLTLAKQDSTGSASSSSEASSSTASAGTPPITSYTEKTVSLHRGNKGFGFVLRGAKASSPVLRSIQSTEKGVTALQPISLQYLDEIEVGGVAQMAGLAKGDFVLNINGVDVRKAPHEHVVCLIRQSGDKVIMSVASPVYLKLEPEEVEREKRDAREKRKLLKESAAVTSSTDSSSLTTSCSAPQGEILQPNVSKSGSQTLPSRSQVPPSGSADAIVDSAGRSRSRAPPPAPPRRDPSTTLTVGRNRAKSLCMSDGRAEGSSEEGSSIDASSSSCAESGSSIPSHSDDGSASRQHEPGSGGASNCGLNNKHDNYDSEGRSDKSSSSASTSIESMIPNANCPPSARSDQNQSHVSTTKIASIRSRGARRMSSLELEEFFARQDDVSHVNRSNSQSKQSSQTLKSKKNKSKSNGTTGLGIKNYHSVPDIQQELLLEQSQMQTMIESCTNQTGSNKSARLSNSQEDLNKKDWIKYAVETVTLKNGKIVQDRNPAPDHPPPPLPPPPASLVPSASDPSSTPSHGLPHPPPSMLVQQSPVVAVTTDSQRKKSDVYAQIKVNPEISGARSSSESGPGMSSFKAPITTPAAPVAAASAESDAHLNAASSLGQEINGKQNQGALKPMKHPNTNRSATAQTSVYARQPTMDPMDERSSNKPFIPEPDYSSEEESVNSKVSKDLSTFKTMNGGNNADRKNNDSLIKNGSSGKTCGGKSGSSPARAVTVSRSDSDSSSSQFPPPPPALLCSTKDPLDPVNKVQASIREFERRSSLTGSESSVTATVSSTNSSTTGSIPTVSGGATTGSKAPVTTKLQQTESLSGGGSNSSKGCHQNVIRMSRSCYEVESSCSGDNGSSGIASDADDPSLTSCTLSNSKVQTLNRRNSAIVSEKIANLIAQTHPSQAAMSQMSAQQMQQLPSSMKQQGSRTLEKRVSIADPPEQPPASSVRAAPTTAKTWSEISSAIKAVKGSPVSQVMAGQSVRPVSAPTAKQLSKSVKDAGLVNEVDVMAELVPPPPEFAAPPPHAAGQHKVQIQVRSSEPRLVEMSVDNLVRVVNPSTGQTHVIHKPQVKTNASPAVQLHPLQANERKTATPPSSSSQDSFPVDRSHQAASGRMSVSMQAPGGGSRMLTPQQQAQYEYLQKQQQLSQQQFATLSRAYSGANQIARLVPVSAAATGSGGHSHQHIVHQMGRPADNSGNRSPQMSRAQFATIAANNNSSQHQHQPTYQMASQGYQQFATLSRAGQKALAAAATGQAGGGVQSAYNDFNRLAVQSRMVNQSPQLSQGSPAQQHVIQWTPQQLQQLTPQQRQALIQRYQMQQQQQQQQVYILHQHPPDMSHNPAGHSHVVHQHVLGKGHAPPPPPQPMQPPPPGPPPSITHPSGPSKAHPVSFPRKSMVEWTSDDVGDWLTSIGMADHRPSFESVNGVKLLRLDNNDLTGMGLRQGQHRIYVMDKIKQYLHYQQQHPPTSAH